MDGQTKELMAIGTSITANCVPCVQFHSGKMRETGVGGAEIQTAGSIGRVVRKGGWEQMG